MANLDHLPTLCQADIVALTNAEKSYGHSWKARGGVGAFMMLARKWDRLENQVKKHGWDVLKAIEADHRPEGIMDDIRDLRRYLLLVESEVREWGFAAPPLPKDALDHGSPERKACTEALCGIPAPNDQDPEECRWADGPCNVEECFQVCTRRRCLGDHSRWCDMAHCSTDACPRLPKKRLSS